METVLIKRDTVQRRLQHITAVMTGAKHNDILLFNPSVLKLIDWSQHKATYKGNRSPDNPGANVLLRPLALQDFERGFLKILSQLTETGVISKELFTERFHKMKSCPGTYFILVAEDLNKGQVIGTTTLVIEQKFIHGAGMRGRIEDVVVSEDYRGLELGKLLVETLTLLSKQLGCYKISLECADRNVRFYEALGYNVDKEKFMVQRFK